MTRYSRSRPTSLLRREHPDAYDLDQFEQQNENQSWHLLWWEKQEQLNWIWWDYQKNQPGRSK